MGRSVLLVHNKGKGKQFTLNLFHVESVEFVEEEYGESAGMDAASIREHEEVTKIKNVTVGVFYLFWFCF